MKISLIYPPNQHGVFQNLGLPYIASVLEQNNHDVEIIDCTAQNMDYADLKEHLKKRKPRIVGVSNIFTPMLNECIRTAQIAKEALPDALTVVGGIHPTLSPQDLVAKGIDVIVVGEGEYTMLDLIDYLKNKKRLKDIDGILYREKNGKMKFTRPRSLIENLDELPLPARHLLNMDKYPGVVYPSNERAICVSGQRGCPYNCIFCAGHHVYGKNVRFRSSKNVIKEIKQLKKDYNIRGIIFYDENLAVDRKRTEELCHRIIAEDLDIIWECQTRVTHVDLDLLKLMKRAGCISIDFGLESGVDEVLQYVKKYTTTEQMKRAVELCHKAGIFACGSFMLGHPCDTKETMLETIRFACKDLGVDLTGFQIATPYPKTEMRDIAIKQKRLIKTDYTQYYTDPSTVDGIPAYSPPGVKPGELMDMRDIGKFLVRFGSLRLFTTWMRTISVSDKNYLKNHVSRSFYLAFKLAGAFGYYTLKLFRGMRTERGKRKIHSILSYYLPGEFTY